MIIIIIITISLARLGLYGGVRSGAVEGKERVEIFNAYRCPCQHPSFLIHHASAGMLDSIRRFRNWKDLIGFDD